MSTQLNKNFTKKLLSIAGIASVAVAFSFPVLAQMNGNEGSNMNEGSTTIMDPNNNDINQPGNVLDTDETSNSEQVLDESNRGNQQRQLSERDNINQRSTTGGINNTNQPDTDVRNTTTDMSGIAQNDGVNRRLVTGGDSVRGVIYRCLNNPNPNCGQ